MTGVRKAWKFLGSMKFALILLLILALACAGGSFISQGQTYEWYASVYSERIASAIILFSLDDVFHSGWFLALTAFLCGNLMLCSISRFPSVYRNWKHGFDPEKKAGLICSSSGVSITVQNQDEAMDLFRRMHFHNVRKGQMRAAEDSEEKEYLYASKNRAGVWGAWLCHVGILIVIIGFGFGQMFKKEYFVYGVPGQSKQVGDTSDILTIDDFQILLRDDDTVEQYIAQITVHDAKSGREASGQISVNHPASIFGMKYYQNSTGWAADAVVLKNGTEIQRETICAGEYLEVEDKAGLVIMFSAFYPDYYLEPGSGPMSLSSSLNNPGYLYRAWYNDTMLGMNVLTGDDVITIDEYTIQFENPQSYTLIQIKKDPFAPAALAGGLVILAALFLAFYLQTQEIWAVREDDESWRISGYSRKGAALFEERIKEAGRAAKGESQ